MKSILKKIALIVFVGFLLIQFYQPARNVSDEQYLTTNLTHVYSVPKNVQTILETSCYDCHSNNTHYPWYFHIQPVGFFMEGHIKEGKEELNFDEFGKYSKRKQMRKLDEISKEIKSDGMPLTSYTLIHRDAILSDNQKVEMMNWVNKIQVENE